MTGLKKIGLILLALIVVAIVLLAVVVPQFIDAEDIRDAITTAASEQTGREVRIDGELSVRTLPCCGIRMAEASVGNAEGFEGEHLVSIGNIDLGIRLWPLLTSATIAADEIVLEDVQVSLHRKANGADNWTFEMGGENEDPAATAEESAVTDVSGLSVAGITVSNAQVRYLDEVDALDLTAKVVSLETGAIEAGEPVAINGQFAIEDQATNTSLDLQLATALSFNEDISKITLGDLGVGAEVRSPDVPGDGLQLELTGDTLNYAVADGIADLDNGVLKIDVAGLNIGVAANGKFAADNFAAAGSMTVAEFSPRELLATLGEPPIETADPEALSAAGITANWQLDGQLLKLANLVVKIDQSSLTGDAQMSALDQSGMKFNLNLDQFDADRYLSPVTDEQAGSPSTETTADTEIPVDTLRGLDLEGVFSIGELRASGATLQNVKVEVSAKNGIAAITSSTADLYEGKYAGSLRMDASGSVPTVQFEQTVDQVQAGGLLTDVAELENVTGLLNAKLSGSSRGQTTDAMTQGLKSDVSFQLVDGEYQGTDLWYEIRKAWALIKQKPQPEAPAEPKTEIGALDFVGQLDDGTLTSRTMKMSAPFLRIDGYGTAEVFEETMDFAFDANVYETPTFGDGEDLSGLRNLTIPIKVKGSFESPSVRVDLGEVLKDAAANKLRDRLYKKLGVDDDESETDSNADDDSEDTKDKLKKGLKDLFGR